ncbi:hypothetical protein F5146DRAFT_1060397 [Armillaria mellea]|nr:hypothetical protein F5146DRAFT_1060397 [Armillaria mellea]
MNNGLGYLIYISLLVRNATGRPPAILRTSLQSAVTIKSQTTLSKYAIRAYTAEPLSPRFGFHTPLRARRQMVFGRRPSNRRVQSKLLLSLQRGRSRPASRSQDA